jgi:DNA replication protein DnaC
MGRTYKDYLEGLIKDIRGDRVKRKPLPYDLMFYKMYCLMTLKAKTGRAIRDDNTDKVIEYLAKYFAVHEDFQGDANKGLFMAGPIGVGKTVMMKTWADMLKVYFGVDGYSNTAYKYVKVQDVVREWEDGGWEVLNKYFKTTTWCFDDLGTENRKAMRYGSQENVMRYVIDIRYDLWQTLLVPTHFITNMNIDAVKEYYGERIVDRIKEMSNIIIYQGQSKRQ